MPPVPAAHRWKSVVPGLTQASRLRCVPDLRCAWSGLRLSDRRERLGGVVIYVIGCHVMARSGLLTEADVCLKP